MSNGSMEQLREQLDKLNIDILKLINQRGDLVQQIGEIKGKQSTRRFDPVRERDMLNEIIGNNDGPFTNATIEHIFKEIFKAGLTIQKDDHQKALLVSRNRKAEDTVININRTNISIGEPHYIF